MTWYQDYMMRITQEMGIGLISPDNINSFSSIRMGDGLSHGDTSLFVLPFTKYTRSLHYLHPGGSDCTHICYTPFVWMPMWRSLRRILDSVASDHKHQGHSYVATFVVSDLRFMLGKMNIRNLGLFSVELCYCLNSMVVKLTMAHDLVANGFCLWLALYSLSEFQQLVQGT